MRRLLPESLAGSVVEVFVHDSYSQRSVDELVTDLESQHRGGPTANSPTIVVLDQFERFLTPSLGRRARDSSNASSDTC